MVNNQELRLRFHCISVIADKGQALILGSDGELCSSAITAKNFALSITRFQIRDRPKIWRRCRIFTGCIVAVVFIR